MYVVREINVCNSLNTPEFLPCLLIASVTDAKSLARLSHVHPHWQLQFVHRHAIIVIVFDLRYPGELRTCHAWIERWLQDNGAGELKVRHEDRRERCASILASLLSPLSLIRLLTAGKAHLPNYC
jgi:hypothetical protein